MGLEILGNAPCLVCGKPATYKRNEKGRVSCVCKWQESGCGSQVQCIGPDSSRILIDHVAKHNKPEKKEVKNERTESGSGSEQPAEKAEGGIFL